MGHRAGLDGLRALAVLAVLAFHTGLLRAGWIGVDVFFALSGYLITGLLITEAAAHGSVRLGDFWRRRARRLVPALLVLLGIVALFDRIGSEQWRAPSRGDIWGTLTYTANWVRLAGQQNYWELFAAPSPLEHVWSLAIEEQFYVLWPLIFMLAWRMRRRTGVIVGAATLAVLSAGWQIWLGSTADGFERIYVGTDTRAPAFLVGALLVAAFDRRGRVLRATSIIVPAGLIALLVACLVFDGESRTTYTGGLLVVSLLGATTVWAAARLDPTSLIGRWLGARPLQIIGRWSYGIYLFHWPIAVLIGVQRFEPWIQFAVVAGASIGLAGVSYEVMESRVRRDGVARRRLIPFALASTAVVAAALSSTLAIEPDVSAAQRAALLTPITVPTATRPVAAEPVSASNATDTDRASSPTTPPQVVAVPAERVLVVGDSVPFHLTGAWLAEAAERRIAVVVRAAPGCRPSTAAADQLRLDTADLCAAILTNVGNDLAQFRPQALVIHFGLADQWVRDAGSRVDACSDSGQALLTAQIGALIDDAVAAGASTYIVLPNDPPDDLGLDRSGANLVGAACYRAAYLDIANARRDVVKPVRLDNLVCPGGEAGCDAVADQQPLRYDGIHFTDEGAAYVVPWMLDQLISSG